MPEGEKKRAMSFKVHEGGDMTQSSFGEKGEHKFRYDPPVHLEAGLEYAVDLDDGSIWQVIGGGHMERIAVAVAVPLALQ